MIVVFILLALVCTVGTAFIAYAAGSFIMARDYNDGLLVLIGAIIFALASYYIWSLVFTGGY